MPVPSPASEARLIVLNPGLNIIITPTKPTITAIQRRKPTCSLKKIADNKVAIMGWTNASASVSGKDIIEIA